MVSLLCGCGQAASGSELLLQGDSVLLVELGGELRDLHRVDVEGACVVLRLAANVRPVRGDDRALPRPGPVRRALPAQHAVNHTALRMADLVCRGLADCETRADLWVPA